MSEQTDGCVKFRKSSWHYKLVSYVTASRYNPQYNYLQWADGEPKRINLCPYVRMVIACSVLLPFMMLWRSFPDEIKDHSDIAKALVIWAFICFGVQSLLWTVEYFDSEWVPPPWWLMLVVYFAGIGAALGVFGLVVAGEAINNRLKQRRRDKKSRRATSLISSYLEAKHNKICPCVEFEEDEPDGR